MNGKCAKSPAKLEAAKVSVPAKIEFSPELFATLCARVAGGELVTNICGEPEMPAPTTFYAWCRRSPENSALHDGAKLARAELFRERIVEINQRLNDGTIDPQSARVMSDNYKWLASKDSPRSFGDKVELSGEVEIINDKPRDDLDLARFVAMVFTKGAQQKEREALEAEGESAALLLNGGGS